MKLRAIAIAGTALVSVSTVLVPTASATPEEFQSCLAKNGVNVQLPPPPKGSKPPKKGEAPPAPPGVDQATWSAAWNACKQYAPRPPKK